MSQGLASRPFNLLRWFAIVSFVVNAAVSAALAVVASRFFVAESIQRDAILTAQFIQNIAEAEVRHVDEARQTDSRLGLTLGQFLDFRVAPGELGISLDTLDRVRTEFYDHIAHLPDALLVTVFAPDGLVVWSTNPSLVGKPSDHNDILAEAIRLKTMIARGHPLRVGSEPSEHYFVRTPKNLYIENYVPLFDRDGDIASIIEVYKEPKSLILTLDKGYRLIWGGAVLAGLVVYLSLFWFAYRAAQEIRSQQKQLVENETLVVVGEMSSAVAHGLRNPLAAIRSSAELAQDADRAPIEKNLRDIINQVDRLSRWVRELLLFAHPLSDAREAMDLSVAVAEVLRGFEQQIKQAAIEVDWTPARVAPVIGHSGLVTQALNSVISNAVEAMPKGGRLSLSVAPLEQTNAVVVTVSDTGGGMTEAQLALACKPFHTTKRTGLGVGLALVKRIMERFGGSIHLASRVNQGTDVRLTFKLSGQG